MDDHLFAKLMMILTCSGPGQMYQCSTPWIQIYFLIELHWCQFKRTSTRMKTFLVPPENLIDNFGHGPWTCTVGTRKRVPSYFLISKLQRSLLSSFRCTGNILPWTAYNRLEFRTCLSQCVIYYVKFSWRMCIHWRQRCSKFTAPFGRSSNSSHKSRRIWSNRYIYARKLNSAYTAIINYPTSMNEREYLNTWRPWPARDFE